MSRNSTAKYLKEGQFLQPSEGVVLFIRAINDTGELEDLFIADSRDEVEQQIYTAQRAYVVDDNGEPKLLMLDGILQRKAKADDIVSTSRFSDFTYSLANLIDTGQGQKRAMAELSTVELILAAPQTAAQGKWRAPAMQYRGHMRLSWPITAGFTAMIGFSALFLGGYSRHGLWWQILIATVLLIGMYLTHILTLSAGPKLQGGAVLAYTTPLLGLAITLWLLWTSGKPRKQNRSRFSPFSRFKTRAS
ncbi:MAG: LptF/LptG family permease [Cypionkella sp.]|nr:LptF/LptG family permease [Cypionkella sp.]